jgi:hypothetical protein
MITLTEIDSHLSAAMKAYLESFASHLPVRRVAVVGNAPLEPSRRRQVLIDSSDLVFRCNSFVLDEPGQEPCLGTKTDVVVAAKVTRVTPWFFQDYRRRAYLVIDAGSTRVKMPAPIPASWPDDLGAWLLSNRLFGLPIKLAMRPETDGRGAVPTTGTEAAYVAHELFPEAQIVLTGFSYLHDQDQQEWRHHWDRTGHVPVAPAHMLDREGAILRSWIEDGSAVFVP